MLINREKTIIDINTPLEGYYLIDESTEEGKLLAEKIWQNYPYFNLVLDNEGNIIDIEPTERLESEEPEPSEIELLTEYLIDVDFRLSMMELGLI